MSDQSVHDHYPGAKRAFDHAKWLVANLSDEAGKALADHRDHEDPALELLLASKLASTLLYHQADGARLAVIAAVAILKLAKAEDGKRP